MKEQVLQYIRKENLIDAGDRVLLGCSGGADSVCLLYLLADLQKTLSFELSVLHVHHHLRGSEADADAELVRAHCEKLQVPFRIAHVDVKKRREEAKLTLEEAARSCRYEAFEEAAAALQADRLALAHHREDRAETMLFQMIRGSGLRGCAGIQPKRMDGMLTVIRPLLNTSKEEILSWNRVHGIVWREDATNLDEELSRNRIRSRVLPALTSIRPDAAEKLSELGAYFTEVDTYLRQEATAWISVYMRHTNGEIPEDPFRDTPKILQEYIVAALLRQMEVPLKDKGRVHIDSIAALSTSQVGKETAVTPELKAVRTYTGIAFEHVADEDAGNMSKSLEFQMETRVFPYKKGMEIPQKEYTKWFDYDKIKGLPVLRTRQEKDVFSQAAGAHKKLKDFLIDEKIPQKERDTLPLVADGQDILWVVGVRMSEDYKVTEDTKNILEINIRRISP